MVNYQIVHSTVGRCRTRVPCLLGEAVGGLLLGPVGVVMGECIGSCVGEVVGAEVGKEVADAVEHVGAPQSAAQQQEF